MLINILLVEDNPGDTRLIQEALKEAGSTRFKLDCTDRLATGLEKLSARKPDAIILDLSLPDSQGLDTFTRVHAQVPEVPIVVLTGLDDETVAVEAMGSGAQDYLLKSELSGGLLVRSLRYGIERKRAEAALRESEERYRALALATAQMVWTTNAQGEVEKDIPAWSALTGQSEEEIRGGGWSNAIHPEDRERAMADWSHAVDTRTLYDTAYRVRRYDGEYRYFSVRGVPVLESDGSIREWVGTCKDITERKRAEKAVAAERQRFNDILDVLPAYVVLMAPDYHVPFANRFFRERFGESHGRCCFEYLFGRTEPCENCESFKVLKTNAPHHWEWAGPDGRNYDISDFPFTDTDGSSRILEMGIDITERRRAEEAVRLQAEQYATMLATTPDGFWRFDANAKLLDVNDVYCRMSGYSRAELLNLHISDIEAIEKSEDVDQHIRKVIETGFDRFESQHRRKDGTVSDVEISVALWRATGQFLLFARDISARKQAERDLHWLNRSLRTISECNQALVRARDESELVQEICRILVEEGGYRLAWVGFAEQDEAKTVRPVAHAGFEEGYLEASKITWADTERGRGPTGTAIRTGQPAVCRNILEDPRFAPWREEAVRRGYASSIALPLILDSQPAGALMVFSQTADAFDAEETQLLTELAEDLAYGIQTLRMRAARARTQEALRRASAYNRSLIETSVDPLVTISPEGKITDVNRGTERVTGCSRAELIGTDFSDYFTDPQKARAGYEQAFREGWVQDYKLEIQHRDGHGTPVEYNASLYRDEAGKVIGVFAAARDITERKRMEEELRQLSGHLLKAQDEERRRIARELHDSTIQNLAAIALNLGLIKESAATDEDRRKYLSETISLTELTLNEIRNISYLLHPPLLDEMGLSPALEYYVKGFSRRSGISVALEITPGLGPLPKDAERTLFRVVQESLTNILRHAGSPTARIAIVRNPEGIVLEVVDRGHGLPTSSAKKPGSRPPRPGTGIPGMRERVRQIGGRLEIESGAQGTTVRATLPFSESGA